MNLEKEIERLAKVIGGMAEQQDIMLAELVATRKALAIMSAYLPMT